MKIIEELLSGYIDKGCYINDDKKSAVQQFCELIEAPSLNVKVNNAVVLRNQGHFNKAMLKTAELQ